MKQFPRILALLNQFNRHSNQVWPVPLRSKFFCYSVTRQTARVPNRSLPVIFRMRDCARRRNRRCGNRILSRDQVPCLWTHFWTLFLWDNWPSIAVLFLLYCILECDCFTEHVTCGLYSWTCACGHYVLFVRMWLDLRPIGNKTWSVNRNWLVWFCKIVLTFFMHTHLLTYDQLPTRTCTHNNITL